MRPDIPPALYTQALSVSPKLAAWLEAAYPTDAEHASHERKRNRLRRQLELPSINKEQIK